MIYQPDELLVDFPLAGCLSGCMMVVDVGREIRSGRLCKIKNHNPRKSEEIFMLRITYQTREREIPADRFFMAAVHLSSWCELMCRPVSAAPSGCSIGRKTRFHI